MHLANAFLACLLVCVPITLAGPIDDALAEVDDALPPERPGCENGIRVRACTHVTVSQDVGARDGAAATCQIDAYADFLFDDPLATPQKGDFSWSYTWSFFIGGQLEDSDGGSGDFEGVPLYPQLGLVQTEGISFDLEAGDSFTMGASARDDNPVMLQVDEVNASFEFTCPA